MAREDDDDDGLIEVTKPGAKAEKPEDGDDRSARSGADAGDLQLDTETVFIPADDDDDEPADDKADGRLSAEGATETSAERSERNRQQREERKRRRKEARDRTLRENRELRSRVEQLAGEMAQLRGQGTQATLTQVNDKLRQAEAAFNQAKRDLADALDRGDSRATLEAIDKRDLARDAYSQLSGVKQRVEAQARQRPQQNGPQLAPEAKRNSDKFAEAIGLQSLPQADVDAIFALDNAVAAEGYDPAGADYWKELKKRALRRLPHLEIDGMDDDDDDDDVEAPRRPAPKTAPRRPPTGTNGGDAAGRKGYEVPKAYVDSLKEAGLWDDPKKRKEMLKRYEISKQKYQPAASRAA